MKPKDLEKTNMKFEISFKADLTPEKKELLDLYMDQQHTIMEAILYGYCHGKMAGADAKVKEIKNILCID
jgi:hypothetical protein